MQSIPAFEHFLLLNGDTYFAVDLKQLTDYARDHHADCCFSLFRSSENGRYMGVELHQDGRIASAKSGVGGIGSLANGGVYCLRRRALMEELFVPGRPASLENEIFPAALAAQRRFLGIVSSGVFIDIGVPTDYLRASQVLGI